jgi:hydrogenase/urease accessory protein HupE
MAACSGGLPGSTLEITGLDRTRTDVLVRVQPLEGAASTVRLTPEDIRFTVPVDPSTGAVFASYFQLGVVHILEGIDHLLFVFALLLLIRSPGRLVGAVTAFTLAHSITLALATLEIVHVPGPPVEAVIALSIVFLAVEILKSGQGPERLSERFPWVVSFSFGLLHGLGFAGALSEIGLPQGDIPAALLAFNVGVEAGQLLFIAAVMAGYWLLRYMPRHGRGALQAVHARRAPPAMAYGIGLVATFWVAERISGF